MSAQLKATRSVVPRMSRAAAADSVANATHGAVSFQPKSRNRKLGPVDLVPTDARPRPVARAPFVASTYVSIAATCSSACPFKDNGCFIQHGPTRGLAGKLDTAAHGFSSLEVIREEVRVLDGAFSGRSVPLNGANGRLDLRLHVGGDVGSEEGARLLGPAVRRWSARGGGAAWTFTHWWRQISREAWGDISVLASVERPQEIDLALQRGYAAAIVVDAFPSERAFLLPGSTARIIPCPAETRGTNCVECRLCLDDRKLVGRNAAIAFKAHGPGKKMVTEALVQLRRKNHDAGREA